MKKSISSTAPRYCNRTAFVHVLATFVALILAGFLFTSCSKQLSEEPKVQSSNSASAESEFMNFYSGLPTQTSWELQQARAATAKYQNIENAIRDGYADINVVVQEMGFHYMKSTLVDANFDPRKPELLVYNREEDGSARLVAVEYAVPLTASQNAPAGFSGDLDVWDH